MKSAQLLVFFLAFGLCAIAQNEEPKLVVKVEGLRYPPIARLARIEGEVIFEVSDAGLKLAIAGHPLLAKPAEENLRTWTLPPLTDGRYLVVYDFHLSDPGSKQQTVPVGNKFDRFFLRLFRAPTTRVEYVCVSDDATETNVRQNASEEGGDYVILVSVRSGPACLQTESRNRRKLTLLTSDSRLKTYGAPVILV